MQRPHPPIVIGGSGPKRTLRAVARHAQHWNMAGGSVDDYARSREILAKHCADIGRNVDEIMTSTHLRLASSTVDAIPAVVEDASRWNDAGLDLGIVYLPPPHTPDVLEPLADALRPLAGDSR